jgi:hypothetical protein
LNDSDQYDKENEAPKPKKFAQMTMNNQNALAERLAMRDYASNGRVASSNGG